MIKINPQYIIDSTGKKSMVILPVKEFETIMEALEDLEDVRMYDKAIKEDNGERVLLSDYLKSREKVNG